MNGHITVGITLTGCRVSEPSKLELPNPLNNQYCIYFPEPGVFLHGTLEDFRSFIDQMEGKLAKLEPVRPDSFDGIMAAITKNKPVKIELNPSDPVHMAEWDDDGPPIEWGGMEGLMDSPGMEKVGL